LARLCERTIRDRRGQIHSTISAVEEAEAFDRIGNSRDQFKLEHRHGSDGCAGKRKRGGVQKVTALARWASTISTAHAGLERGRNFTRDSSCDFENWLTISRESAGRLQSARPAKRGDARIQRHAAREFVSSRYHALRHFPLPEFHASQTGDDLEDADRVDRDMPEGHGISYGRTFITRRPMRVATLSAVMPMVSAAGVEPRRRDAGAGKTLPGCSAE